MVSPLGEFREHGGNTTEKIATLFNTYAPFAAFCARKIKK